MTFDLLEIIQLINKTGTKQVPVNPSFIPMVAILSDLARRGNPFVEIQKEVGQNKNFKNYLEAFNSYEIAGHVMLYRFTTERSHK